MLQNVNLKEILFFDIETVPQQPSFAEVSEETQKLWEYRINRFKPEDSALGDYYFEKAGVYAEFGKVICISIGFFAQMQGDERPKFRLKSFYGDDERPILEAFSQLINQFYSKRFRHLCGHNIREFDVPFLGRRILINHLPLPVALNIYSLKPWEVPYLDTMKIWRFGDYRNYTSLHLLSNVMGIPNPKQDIEGKDVAHIYWSSKDVERIKEYCQNDVLAVARLIQKFKGLEIISDEDVLYL